MSRSVLAAAALVLALAGCADQSVPSLSSGQSTSMTGSSTSANPVVPTTTAATMSDAEKDDYFTLLVSADLSSATYVAIGVVGGLGRAVCSGLESGTMTVEKEVALPSLAEITSDPKGFVSGAVRTFCPEYEYMLAE